MSEQLRELAIKESLTFYKNDLASESIDENNVVLSFPVHFSGFHRVELTITRIHSDQFVISDGAKTIEELKSAGYHMDSKLRNRLETISRTAKIRVVNEYLVAESNVATLGSSIQRFVEATKTIGDAYLVQRSPAIRDTNLWSRVGDFSFR